MRPKAMEFYGHWGSPHHRWAESLHWHRPGPVGVITAPHLPSEELPRNQLLAMALPGQRFDRFDFDRRFRLHDGLPEGITLSDETGMDFVDEGTYDEPPADVPDTVPGASSVWDVVGGALSTVAQAAASGITQGVTNEYLRRNYGGPTGAATVDALRQKAQADQLRRQAASRGMFGLSMPMVLGALVLGGGALYLATRK